MVNENIKNVIRQRMERTAEALRNNCMEAYVVADEKEAKAKVEELLFEGAAIGVGGGLLFTTPFARKYDVVVSPTVNNEGGCSVYFSMRF